MRSNNLVIAFILIIICKSSTGTRLSERQRFNASDFVYDLKNSKVESQGEGGRIQPLTVSQMPSLEGQGVSYTLFTLEACGINLPHVHPRATEVIYVIKGSNLRTGFIEENSGRTIINDIKEGQSTFFPQGLIHYQQNLGCDTVQYLSALNSEDPGVVTLSNQMFTLPVESLISTLNVGTKILDRIKNDLPVGPGKGWNNCVKRCAELKSKK